MDIWLYLTVICALLAVYVGVWVFKAHNIYRSSKYFWTVVLWLYIVFALIFLIVMMLINE